MADEIVETVAPVADAESVAIETPPVKPERNKTDERIGELTYRLKQAEAELQKRAAPVEQPKLVKPQLSDENIGYDEEKHKAAMDEYNESRLEQLAEAAAVKLLEKRDTEAKTKARDAAFSERLNKLSEADRATAVSAHVNSIPLAVLIMESEVGPDVLLHLANNPDIAAALDVLPEKQQAREFGRLEVRLERPVVSSEPKPVAVSKAPPPSAKLEATNSAIEKDPKDMSDAEFDKWRQRQIAQRR